MVLQFTELVDYRDRLILYFVFVFGGADIVLAVKCTVLYEFITIFLY